MSAKEELTIAVLIQFVTTSTDPTTAHVNQDIKGTEIIAQVISFVNSSFLQIFDQKVLSFLFFYDKMLFIAILC